MKNGHAVVFILNLGLATLMLDTEAACRTTCSLAFVIKTVLGFIRSFIMVQENVECVWLLCRSMS